MPWKERLIIRKGGGVDAGSAVACQGCATGVGCIPLGLAPKEYISVVIFAVSSEPLVRDSFVYEFLQDCAGCWETRPPGCPITWEMRFVKNSGANRRLESMADSHLTDMRTISGMC